MKTRIAADEGRSMWGDSRLTCAAGAPRGMSIANHGEMKKNTIKPVVHRVPGVQIRDYNLVGSYIYIEIICRCEKLILGIRLFQSKKF